MAGEERRRLASDRLAWLRWGPYLSERAWATVREDYSADGDPWRVADLILRKYRPDISG